MSTWTVICDERNGNKRCRRRKWRFVKWKKRGKMPAIKWMIKLHVYYERLIAFFAIELQVFCASFFWGGGGWGGLLPQMIAPVGKTAVKIDDSF